MRDLIRRLDALDARMPEPAMTYDMTALTDDELAFVSTVGGRVLAGGEMTTDEQDRWREIGQRVQPVAA